MLNENSIKEAKNNLQIYLDEGLIKKTNTKDQNIIQTYLKNAKESLDLAQHSYDEEISYMWTTVCSYYSMFYIANCLLYINGYKIGDKIAHKVTCDCLIALMRDKIKKSLIENYKETSDQASEFAQIKTDYLLENINYERKKRSKYQYETSESIKKSKSLSSLNRAKEFMLEIRKIIGNHIK